MFKFYLSSFRPIFSWTWKWDMNSAHYHDVLSATNTSFNITPVIKWRRLGRPPHSDGWWRRLMVNLDHVLVSWGLSSTWTTSLLVGSVLLGQRAAQVVHLADKEQSRHKLMLHVLRQPPHTAGQGLPAGLNVLNQTWRQVLHDLWSRGQQTNFSQAKKRQVKWICEVTFLPDMQMDVTHHCDQLSYF